MPTKHFLQLKDFSRADFEYLLERTRWIKDRFKRYEIYQPLRDCTLAMAFEKASSRTRVSFEAGVIHVGATALNLNARHTFGYRGHPNEYVPHVSRVVRA